MFGLVQDLTEFLPISSSAHLRITSALFQGGRLWGRIRRDPWIVENHTIYVFVCDRVLLGRVMVSSGGRSGEAGHGAAQRSDLGPQFGRRRRGERDHRRRAPGLDLVVSCAGAWLLIARVCEAWGIMLCR